VWWVGGHSNKLSPVSCAFSFLGGLKTVFNPPEFQFCATLHLNSGHQLNACGAEFCIFRRSFRIWLLRQQPNDLPPMLMCVKIGKIRPVVWATGRAAVLLHKIALLKKCGWATTNE
jgi:hypothetical protein